MRLTESGWYFFRSFYHMTRSTVLCKARSMPRKISVDFCVPNPVHPECKQCNSPRIAEMKPEDQARLKSHGAKDAKDDELPVDDPGGYEPDEDDFEELKEE